MNHVCIDVDVWCKYIDAHPIYRVYVDDEMLTERTFIWSSTNNYIREHIEVFIDSGEHEVKIVNCGDHHTKFITNNITVNGKPSGARFTI